MALCIASESIMPPVSDRDVTLAVVGGMDALGGGLVGGAELSGGVGLGVLGALGGLGGLGVLGGVV